MTLFTLLDYAAVLVFAATGALTASRAQLDVVGFIFLACLTGVGGGTVRDLLLDRNPVFWIADPSYLAVASGAALVVFLTAHRLESRIATLRWLDAAALAVAAAAGSGIAVSLGQPAPIVVVMGMTTGCLGGLMRDVVANDVPVVLIQGELYVTCALAGSMMTLACVWLGFGDVVAAIGCAAVTFGLRAGTLALGWSLPTYKSTPPREKPPPT
ncbi:trimeric intracellular cation channel family protein [Roseivivax sp. CAU 1753]